MSNWHILVLSLSSLILSCSRVVDRKLTNNSVQKISESPPYHKRYIQTLLPVVDTIKSYENTKFLLKLKNSSNKDVHLVRISYKGNMHFELRPGTLPLSIPAENETSTLIKMIMADGSGWYEGTVKFTFSDSTIETLSRKIYAEWPVYQTEKGITRLFKDPFPLEIKDNRVFIEKREIKVEVKFISHYFVQLFYANKSNDSIFITAIDYNKNIVSWHEPPPKVIPPKTSYALIAKIELGSYKDLEETITITFNNRPLETIRVKLSIDYLDDLILTRQDTLCAPPLFGGKRSEYQSEIAFDQYVKDNYNNYYFETLGIFGSGNTFVFNFMINQDGQITDLNCEYNKFPQIEKYLKDILIKSPKWALPNCIKKNKQSKKADRTFYFKYKYRVYFPQPMESNTSW